MASKGNEKTPVDQFIARITAEYDTLSKQLKIIAKYVEQHRDHIGIEGIQQLAANCQVQPSAVVRFAKRFGFSGFRELQSIFRSNYTETVTPTRSYQQRVRQVIADGQTMGSDEIARRFIDASRAGLDELVSRAPGAVGRSAQAFGAELVSAAQTSAPAQYDDITLLVVRRQ